MDVSKLTPLPLRIVEGDGEPYVGLITGFPVLLSEQGNIDDLEWYLLARNAFDVMMRRKWEAEYWFDSDSWSVDSALAELPSELSCGKLRWPDPFTALVEADRWYKENVEK